MTPQPNVLIIPLKVFVLNKNGESLKGLTVGTAEGTRTPNIQNRKQKLKNLVSIGALGASGFSIFVATALATIAIFLDTRAVQEGNSGV